MTSRRVAPHLSANEKAAIQHEYRRVSDRMENIQMKCPICGCEPMDGETHNTIVSVGDAGIETECRVLRTNPTLPFHVFDGVKGTDDGAEFFYHRRPGALFGG